MGRFRSTISKNEIRFTTINGQEFERTILPGTTESVLLSIPQNTVQATVNISWGIGVNDFGLKLFASNGQLIGESNFLNVTGLTGRREKIVAQGPAAQTARASIQHTGGVGVVQNVVGSMQITTVDFPNLKDLDDLSADSQLHAERSLLRSILLPEGSKFKPDSTVSRADFAATLLRAGLVAQYMASQPVFSDVRDSSTRSIVESVQSGPSGQLIFDAQPGGRFHPNNNVTRLVAAVAFVRAAGLESAVSTAALPLSMADQLSIPTQFRGYVAVALQNGFMSLDGNKFDPSRAMTRVELARSTNILIAR
jgi:hypothetical protein